MDKFSNSICPDIFIMPIEIIFYIISHTDLVSIARLMQCSKQCYDIAKNYLSVYTRICDNDYEYYTYIVFADTNVLHGIYLDLYEPNYIHIKRTYVNGDLHGEYIEYDIFANIMCIKHYHYGVYHGKYIEYHNNTRLSKECYYNKGLRHGKYIKYNSKQKVIIECDYIRGLLHGKYIENYYNGNRRKEQMYYMGICINTVEYSDNDPDRFRHFNRYSDETTV